jgi:hypothetical protein
MIARNMALLATLGGCTIGGASSPRPSDLEDDWEVTRLRLLGVSAEPAEARPGDQVTFSALFADPEGVAETIVWLACPPDAASAFGCAVDFSALPDNPTPDALAAAGVIGIEPFFSPTYTVPTDLLDGLEPAARLEGAQVTIQVSAFPSGALDDPANVDFNDVEAGYKRLVVSEATTPNHNPRLGPLQVDGVALPPDTVVELEPDEKFGLDISILADTVETYAYVSPEGVAESRVEEPYITWYATSGTLYESYTLYPFTEATWVSPMASGTTGTWYAVVRDRRGGLAWRSQRFAIR